jgi:hypothetical protein
VTPRPLPDLAMRPPLLSSAVLALTLAACKATPPAAWSAPSSRAWSTRWALGEEGAGPYVLWLRHLPPAGSLGEPPAHAGPWTRYEPPALAR